LALSAAATSLRRTPRAIRAIAGAEIAAIYGTNTSKVANLCREHGGKPYQDFDAFLAQSPDGNGSHRKARPACTPFKALPRRNVGLHVLTEKPIDISAARADTLIEAAERSGVKLGVMFSGPREAWHPPTRGVDRRRLNR